MKGALFFQITALLAGCGGEDGGSNADADADTDADSDADTDSGTGSSTGDDFDYPPPPYGVEVGTIIQNLQFAGDGRIISMKDFYDDPTTRLLMIWGTAGW